jgi:hypothetical protein
MCRFSGVDSLDQALSAEIQGVVVHERPADAKAGSDLAGAD